jgi:predicted permease
VALDRYSIEAVEKMMARFGVPQEEIDKAIKTAQNTDNFSIGNMLLSFAFTCILWFLFSLIIAAIVKKKKPLIDFTSIKSS